VQLAQTVSLEPPQAALWNWLAGQVEQVAQTVSVVAVQAADWYSPTPQGEQATQTPLLR
jgi:hypothetical protein